MLSYTQFFLFFFGDLLLWKKPILEVKQNNTKETNPHAEDNKQSRSRTRIIEDEIYETLKEKKKDRKAITATTATTTTATTTTTTTTTTITTTTTTVFFTSVVDVHYAGSVPPQRDDFGGFYVGNLGYDVKRENEIRRPENEITGDALTWRGDKTLNDDATS